MKKIDDITVTVTYKVSLSDIKVSNTLFKQLENLYEYGLFDSSERVIIHENSSAIDWITNNINEEDAYEWEYEIDDLTEGE
jgi:hypothetical protein